MDGTPTWHDIYGQLMTTLRKRSPSLAQQPTEAELEAAIQACVGPREILEWAKAEGPLST